MNYLKLIFVFFLMSCGGDSSQNRKYEKPNYNTLNGMAYEVLTSSNSLWVSSKLVRGKADILFKKELPKVKSANHFEISFKMYKNSKFSFIANSEKDLRNGIELSFETINGNLKALLKTDQKLALNISSFFENIDFTENTVLGIDIHNDHAPMSHIIIWLKSENYIGKIDSENPIFDRALLGRGFGDRFGVKMDKLDFYGVFLSPAKGAH